MSADETTVRGYIRAQLAPSWPSSWRFVPFQSMPQTIDTTTVILKHEAIDPDPKLPVGQVRNRVILTVADPHEGIEAAEDALDDAVVDLLTSLDGHRTIGWTSAEKVAVEGRYLGWDITLTVLSSIKKPEAP